MLSRGRCVEANGAALAIGILTPHAAVGPEAELPEMAPGKVAAFRCAVEDQVVAQQELDSAGPGQIRLVHGLRRL
jgi:hypothetical protein